ncbi:hypothetical protein F5Y12DRAFT_778694 [Xylaria sp. FL1777]|nr:hypothetical protein F5Y12DRAFT_778694 [Xylaria sp. FL1777]
MAGNGSEQNIHFRTACDPCSRAKVRCDKKHPACDRCVQFKLQCLYSHSRRHGRRALRRRLAYEQMKIPTSTGTEDLALITAIPIAPAVSFPDPPKWSPSLPSSALLMGGQDPQPLGSYEEDEVDDTLALLSSIPLGGHSGAAEISINPFTSWDLSDLSPSTAVIHHSLRHSELACGETSQGTPASIERLPTVSNPVSTHDCEAQAISILRSMQHGEMHEGATSCSTNPIRYTELNLRPSFDRVLAINKAALDGCARLMKCSCALCPHIILLHVSILSKVLFWYRIATIDKTNYPRDIESQSSPHTLSQSPEDPPTLAQFSVTPTRIQIGALNLDTEDETSLRRVLLLRELRRTEGVIDELINVDRTALDENGDDVVRSSVQWSLGGISRVKEELQDAIQKIDQS